MLAEARWFAFLMRSFSIGTPSMTADSLLVRIIDFLVAVVDLGDLGHITRPDRCRLLQVIKARNRHAVFAEVMDFGELSRAAAAAWLDIVEFRHVSSVQSLWKRQMPQRVKFRVKEIGNHPIEIVTGDHHKKKQDGTQHHVLQRLGRRKTVSISCFVAIRGGHARLLNWYFS